ncbi:MAG TPA: glycosyltransferase family 2 protein [Thermoanaerobaculia bacterium]|nr:glycosyltransferase family 2 protein [Thermoanaerobaculia bacterium]
MAFGLAAFLLGLQLLLLFPLSLAYGFWKRQRLRRLPAFRGRVSVIVPAFNEEKTLRGCVESILASDYPDLEVIVVNDGSTDGTGHSIHDIVESERVRYLEQANGGKAPALNRGAASASGEVLVFTDADSLFLPDTVGEIVRWFADPGVHAVCGNDTPLSAWTPLQKALAVTTHIGTGFVRRALSVVGVLPIITGNLGAIRAATFRQMGGFDPVWGEDLDLTFRLQRARKRIVFDPDSIVRAECPASLSALWRQRVRWARSYLKITRRHRDLLWPLTAPPFSLYLPLNYFAQVVVPLLQLLSLPLLFRVALGGGDMVQWVSSMALYLGLLSFFGVALYSILLDRDWKALRFLPHATLLIVPLSYFYDLVLLVSVWKELRGEAEHWGKIERAPTGLLSRWGGASLALAGVLVIAVAGAARISTRSSSPVTEPSRAIVPVAYARGGEVALATHFDGWDQWHRAVQSVLENPDAQGMHLIALGAGRPEWTFFRWEGHRAQWSSTQTREAQDLLGQAALAFKQRGFRTVAIVDLYAPTLLKKDPSKAAVRFDGVRSPEQVEFMELLEGEYGRQVLQMISFLARHYPIDAVALTEVAYQSFCFDEACLASYRSATNRADWPRTRVGTVDRDDPSIWEWRSARMEGFLARASAAVHAAGKKLFVDVPVSWSDFRRHGKDAGLDYGRVLRHADRIVVWNYFSMEDRGPEVSLALAQDLRRGFPPDRVFLSIGLWGSQGTLEPKAFEEALAYTLKGGMPNLWITPNHLLTPRHWAALTRVLGKPGA